ncbi:uncharacterized protein EV154DRAFT_528031 [Mucor mucedo]|uniref:uncharacterized protein n=1 Tax=Mucor mucedo TaxID=29922 RepID=UPI002220BE37|nr:uncharacterized protein EV154DRAFT_528031 [Mucor mucedo]KAI7873444.1 hypothetical protein EV154DRAFT_528031 [Mucor mucedo]
MKITRTFPILLLLLSTSTSKAQEYSCLSLRDSVTCPAYKNFYLSPGGLAQQYPFLSNVTDVQSFDEGMKQLMKTANPYYVELGCSNKASSSSTTIPYARYSLSYLCASLIQDSLYSLPCNFANKVNPPPLCQSTCFDYTASVQAITSNSDVCFNQELQSARLENMNSSCVYWSGLNGTLDCIPGIANEPNNCGYQLESDGCAYCKTNGTDTCCQTIRGCNGLSVGAIIGIIIGSLALAGMMGAAFFFVRYKNSRKKNGVSYTGNKFSMNHKTETNDRSNGIGYEALGSQGALVQSEQPFLKPSQLDTALPPLPLPLSLPPQGGDLEEFYQVKHPYPPQMGDELGLHVGDIVCVAMNFDDGWALGFNVTTGLKGVFPVVCVAPAPEELLEQLLFDQPTNKTLVEEGSLDHLNMQQICENLRRSISISSKRTINTLPSTELTQHGNIPRRTASMMRSNYDYRESDSPTSPTTRTPFFDVNILQQQQQNNSLSQPEPALFQPIETYEMHRKNNRVSKLEEP